MKPWYQSKTIWFNGLVVALTIIVAWLQTSEAMAIFPSEWNSYILAFMAAANIFLRTVTTKPITGKPVD